MTDITYNYSDSLEELRAQLVWRLSVVLVVFGVAATWYVLIRRDLPFEHCLIPFLAVILGRVVQVSNAPRPVFARYVLIGGMSALLLGAMSVFNNPWIPSLGVLCVFVSAMLLANSGLITAGAIITMAVILNVLRARTYALLDLATLLTLASASSWLIAYTLFTAVHWYSGTQLRSQELLEITRDHRAELSRTLKSLQIAYDMQKHIQLELIWARRHADDARRLKDQFAANISHELWTPLNLILGFTEVMYLSPDIYGEMDWPPGLRRDIHQIYRNSQHLRAMIGDILDLSRFEMNGFHITRETVMLAPLLLESLDIVENLVRGRPLSLHLSLESDLPPLEMDCTRIRQVLINLLNNALRFTESGTITVIARQAGREVLISVRDTGTGIAADKLPFVFDEFYQANPSLSRSHGGAGLGLAISKRFVEAHGGRIWVESTEHVGSCFTFALPIAEQYLKAEMSSTRLTVTETLRRTVLVLDADPSLMAILAHYLASYDLVAVRGVNTLREMILTYHPKLIIRNADSHTPSLEAEILDIGVPIIECTLPTIAWSAEALGVAVCVPKPITTEALLHEIDLLGPMRDVLLVFSDRGFALVIERMLQTRKGAFQVRRTYDTEQALSALHERRPDLVIMDRLIPDASGQTFVDYLHADPEQAAIPVMLFTSSRPIDGHSIESQFVLRQHEGLYPIEIFNALHGIVESLKPRYYSL